MGDGHEVRIGGPWTKEMRGDQRELRSERAQRCGLTLNLCLTGVRMRWMDPPADRASVDGQGCGIKVKGVQVGIDDVDISRI